MRKHSCSAVLLVLLVLLGISISGCGSSSSTPITPIVVSISPATVTLSEGETQQFTATVTGTSQTVVIWSVTGCTGSACGTITSTGLYTAPPDIPNAATVTVLATVLNSTSSANATVNHRPPSEAQGVYSGTSFYAGSNWFYSVVLPNDRYYAFYEADVFGPEMCMMTGVGKSADGTFTATISNYYLMTVLDATLTATYVPGASMTGSIVLKSNGYTTTFDATALPSSLFEWDTPANLADIAGTWGPITINPDGTFTGSNGDCSFSGTLTPHSKKNFFNLTIGYGGAPCPTDIANQGGSGIAIETLLPDGNTRLLLAGAPVGLFGERFVIAERR